MNKVQLLNNAVCFGSFPPREMPQRRSSRQISKETENGEDHAPRQSSKREAQQWICLMNSEIWSCIGWFGYLITFYRPGCRYTRCTFQYDLPLSKKICQPQGLDTDWQSEQGTVCHLSREIKPILYQLQTIENNQYLNGKWQFHWLHVQYQPDQSGPRKRTQGSLRVRF